MASTPDTTPLNPFNTDATKHASDARQRSLIEMLDGLRAVNYDKGSEVSAELAALFAPSTKEDGDVNDQTTAAKTLSSQLDALLDFLGNGLVATAVAPASALTAQTPEEEMLLRDFRDRKIVKETAEQKQDGQPTVVHYAFADSRVGKVRRLNSGGASSATPAPPAGTATTTTGGKKGPKKAKVTPAPAPATPVATPAPTTTTPVTPAPAPTAPVVPPIPASSDPDDDGSSEPDSPATPSTSAAQLVTGAFRSIGFGRPGAHS